MAASNERFRYIATIVDLAIDTALSSNMQYVISLESGERGAFYVTGSLLYSFNLASRYRSDY
jgi:hypothetical protein